MKRAIEFYTEVAELPPLFEGTIRNIEQIMERNGTYEIRIPGKWVIQIAKQRDGTWIAHCQVMGKPLERYNPHEVTENLTELETLNLAFAAYKFYWNIPIEDGDIPTCLRI